MKTIRLSLLLVVFLSFQAFAQFKQLPPKILTTIPQYADSKVDPGLKEIIVIFDQDMSGGMSLINTPNTPKQPLTAYWKDKRTYIIPVQLNPGKLYSLKFNSKRFTNFRSTVGIPLNPDELIFKTQVVDFTSLNLKSYNELFNYFPGYYSHNDLKKIEWEGEFIKVKKDLIESSSNIDFALILAKVIRKAEDPHLFVEIEDQRYYSTIQKIVPVNFNINELFNHLTDVLISNSFDFIGGKIENAGYIYIRSWESDIINLPLHSFRNSQVTSTFFDFLNSIKSMPDIIIDVRENAGGNEFFAKEFASLFILDSLPYEKTITRNPSTGKFDIVNTSWLYPSDRKIDFRGNLYVLSGPTVMSSNESFILMMKQIKNAKVVGMKTYGSSGNPKPVELSNGVKIFIPSWQSYTLDGKQLEGNGIEPDILIETAESDFISKDVLIENLLKLIADKK